MRQVKLGLAAVCVVFTLVMAPLSVAHAAPPQATFAYALTDTNRLLLFNVNTPGTILRNVQITGLQPGDDLLGIDARPATGELFGVGRSGRVYVINPVSGQATPVSPLAAIPGYGPSEEIGMDFNPVVDRIRIVSDLGTNRRLNPNTGATAAIDPNLNGATTSATGAAYTNNFPGTAGTTLYDISPAIDSLVIQAPPNNGTLTTVGPLGVNTSVAVGFDIVTVGGVNSAYASLTVGGNVSRLYTINLGTGAATLVGPIGSNQLVFGLAIASGELVCTVPAGTAGVTFVAAGGAPTTGTAGADVICGTAGPDRIAGLGGDDLILGRGGDDQVSGGDGKDDIYGGAGNDQLVGSAGDDFLFGNAGNDDLAGDAGSDSLYGNAGGDRLAGGTETDVCRVVDGPANSPAEPGDQAAPAPSCEAIL